MIRPSTILTPPPLSRPPWTRRTLACALLGFIASFALLPNSSAATLRQLLTDPEIQTVFSSSGQFLVAAPRSVVSAPAPSRFSNQTTNLVELTPHVLVVSCENIKSALLRTLHLPDFWFGRIHVIINPHIPNGQPALIGARLFLDGWQYQVELPPASEPIMIVRAIVHTLLLEFANRNAAQRSAEIPLWLSEGLTQVLVHTSLADLVVPRPRLTINDVQVRWQNRPPARRDPLLPVRERFRSHAPLSFSRMGEFDIDQLPQETWETFQASSHLFLDQLLRLPNSHQAIAATLFQLPHHLNWQIAFLKGFNSHFPRLLDAEKWWSVILIHFTGLDSANAWSVEHALQKIEETIRPPVLLSHSRSDLPRRTNLSLQQIISTFDYLRQRILIRDVSHRLQLLRLRTPLQVVSILDNYRHTLDNYVARRDRAGMTRPSPSLPPISDQRLVNETLRNLDDLDRQRTELAANP